MQRNERFPVVRMNETIWMKSDAIVKRINRRMRFDPMLIEYFVFENAHLAWSLQNERKLNFNFFCFFTIRIAGSPYWSPYLSHS